MREGLPKGWAQAPISRVAIVNPRHPRGLEDSLEVSFAPMACLSESSPTMGGLSHRPLGQVRTGFTHFAEGDVLFAKITPCMENGKGAIAIGLKNGLGCGTTELHVLRPTVAIDASYLYHFSHQASFRKSAEARFTGSAGQARVPAAFFDEVEIPIPPMAEQSRIVAKLESLLAKVDASRERLECIPVILKRFRQAVLAAACDGRLTEDWRESAPDQDLVPPSLSNSRAVCDVESITTAPNYWQWVPLASLCDPARFICYGVIKLGPETPNGVPCLRTSDVKPLFINTLEVKRIEPEISEQYQRTILQGGEVLVNVRGTLGGVAVVPPELRKWNISREVAVVPVKGVLPSFIAFWIASMASQNWLTSVAKGVAYTGINIEDLRLLPIPLPSIPEQNEIVRRVSKFFGIADQIEARYTKAKAQMDRLPQSILAKAFRGELVPQDPNDEPADVLLSRLASSPRRPTRGASHHSAS